MSRKSYRSANNLASMAAEALAMDNFSPHRQSYKRFHNCHEPPKTDSEKGASHSHSQATAPEKLSPHTSSADEGGGGEFGGADAANSGNTNEDEDNEDSEDPAVMAPSDYTVGTRCGLAGLTDNSVSALTDLELAQAAPGAPPVGEVPTVPNEPNEGGQQQEEDEDDDQDYNAVDLISESDGEDLRIERLEEANILSHITEDLDDFNILGEGSLFPGHMPYFDEQMRRMEDSNLSQEMQMYKSTDVFDSFPSAPSPPPSTPITATRRVHFDASALNAPTSITFEQEILLGCGVLDDNDDISIGSMSGYETDGETTDEDEIPVNTTKSPRALLRQPSWGIDLLHASMPARGGRNVRQPLSKPHRPPRLGTWVVNPGKALGQSDASHNIVVLEPKEPAIPDELSNNCGGILPTASSVTGCLVAPVRTPVSDADDQLLDIDQLDAPDPVLSTGTNAAMEDFMESIIGDEGSLLQSQPPSSTFVPATDVFDELGFATANSDHESTDLDIMDYITFSEDSSDETAKEFRQADENANEIFPGVEQPTETLAPLVTANTSHAQMSPSSTTDDALKSFHANLFGGLRRARSKTKTPTPLRRPHSGLALTRPATRGNNRHSSSTPDKFEKKRKLSDSFASSSRRPSLRTRVSGHQ